MTRTTRTTAFFFCLLALASVERSAPKTIAQRAVEISIGNRVELRMKAHRWTPVMGHLRAVNSTGIEIQTKDNGVTVEKPISFTEIRSLRDRGNQRLATRVFAQIGAAGAVILGLLGLLVLASGN